MSKIIFVERGDDDQYRATIKGAERATAVGSTQKEAAEAAQAIHPDAKILAERQRKTDQGGRDKWRRFY